MAGDLRVEVTSEDRAAAKQSVHESSRGTTAGGIALFGVAAFGGIALGGELFPDASGLARAALWAALTALLAFPLLMAVSWLAKGRAAESDAVRIAQSRKMTEEAKRRDFATRLIRGLEMADDEAAAYDIVERSMANLAPEAAIELLLADNSHAHLQRVVVSSPEGEAPGCPVDSPDRCVAARRAQTQVFADSEDLDACPLLRDREQGRCSGVCVPVAVMGRTVGVMHSTSPPGHALDDAEVQMLQVLANQSGNRLGMLRVMAETQVQAATDGLTGLMNRRSLENRLRIMRNDGVDFAFVMADLDHFKALNDANGHEAGDRALRIFSDTLRREIRGEDLVCRYGGEEFALAFPGVDPVVAIEVVERVRASLASATGRGDTAAFTASYGVASSADADDLEDLVQRADRALFQAKEAGRDRICTDGSPTATPPTLTALA